MSEEVNPFDLTPSELRNIRKTVEKYRSLIRIEERLGKPNQISRERLKRAATILLAQEYKIQTS